MPVLKNKAKKQLGGFDWDKGNETKNELKHGVSNKEAEQIFFNKPIVYDDKKHSTKREKRFYAFGQTNRNKLLTVVFTVRGEKIRIISARPMGKREKQEYLK